MIVLGIAAGVLVVAAVAQGVRIGIRRGDWTPIAIGVGLVLACAALLAVLSLTSEGK